LGQLPRSDETTSPPAVGVEKATVEAVSAYISKSLIRDLSDPVFGFPEEVPKSEEVEVEVELIELRTCEGEVVEEVAT